MTPSSKDQSCKCLNPFLAVSQLVIFYSTQSPLKMADFLNLQHTRKFARIELHTREYNSRPYIGLRTHACIHACMVTRNITKPKVKLPSKSSVVFLSMMLKSSGVKGDFANCIAICAASLSRLIFFVCSYPRSAG